MCIVQVHKLIHTESKGQKQTGPLKQMQTDRVNSAVADKERIVKVQTRSQYAGADRGL
jgi:hypothetical protein